jgi:lysozyme
MKVKLHSVAILLIGVGTTPLSSLPFLSLDSIKFERKQKPVLVKGTRPLLVKGTPPSRGTEIWQKRALNGIKSFENFEPKAYVCPAGVKTIGYGCTKKKAVSLGSISHEKAIALLKEDYEYAAKKVDSIVKVPLTPYQRVALVSFTLNCGEGNLARLVNGKERLNAGNYESVELILPLYRRGDGKILNGLVRRRAWELTLWNAEIEQLASN